MADKTINIPLSEELIEKLENKIKETDFDSITDYILYLLKQVLEKEGDVDKKELAYSKEEEEAVKKRLKELGYI